MTAPDTQRISANLPSVRIILRCIIIHQDHIRHPKCPHATVASIICNLASLLVNPICAALAPEIFDTLSLISDDISSESRNQCLHALRSQYQLRDRRLDFLLGTLDNYGANPFYLSTHPPLPNAGGDPSAAGATPTSTLTPFPLKRWEMVQAANPVAGDNDSSLSLSLFGAMKSVL
jgi:hypothetical protein